MSTTLLSASPVSSAPLPAHRRRTRAVAAILVGLLGAGLAVALPFAPVLADRTTVSWPAQGEQPTSTTALFVPYRPAELRAEVPCQAVQAALATEGRTVVLATSLVRSTGPATGLVVGTEAGQLDVMVNGRVVHSSSPPASGCDVRVDADDAATSVSVGADAPTVLAGQPVPEVFAFTTDLAPEDAAGTTVTARTRNWFESNPSGTKTAMAVTYVVVALLALTMLLRWTGAPSRHAEPSRTEGREPRRAGRAPGRSARLAGDAFVVAALGLWLFIAPQTDDDGYASMTIRNASTSGDIGNYYHWFNASEAPFTLVQHIVQPLAALSAAPLWFRLPSILAGLAAWFVINRGVLGALLPQSSRGPGVTALSAVAFLAWWLPFNTGVRPEPFVALGAATVLALLLRGLAPTARRPLLFIGGAALVAGISLSITPSAMLTLAPVLVLLPRIWRTVRAVDASWWATVGIAALLTGLASAGVVLMFIDQTWRGVAQATLLHNEIGPSLKWYEEATRYSALLGGGSQGTATKRLAVLLTIGLLLVVVPLLARRLPELRRFPDAHVLAGTVAVSFALLFATPSKWSHHFGSLAGYGIPFLVLGCLLLLEVARGRHRRDRVVLVTGLAGAGVVALATALSFSGPNAWFIYSSLGLPYRDRAVTPFGIPLGNPVLWLLGAALVAGAIGWWNRRKESGDGASPLVLAPAVIAVAALAASAGVLLVGFTVAPLRQAEVGGYSLAATNVDTLTGTGCGITDKVQVLLDSPAGPLAPAATGAGDESSDGFVPGAGFFEGAPPQDAPGSGASTYLWGSLADGEQTTGTLVSPWFDLPRLSADQDVTVDAAGRTGGADRLELEFGRSGGPEDAVTPLARRGIGDGAVDQPGWRPLSVAAGDVPATADRVRVVAADESTDVGGWLAVTGPRVRTAEDLQTWLSEQSGPVLPDWPLAWHLPCVGNLPTVADGLAQTPGVIIAAPRSYGAANIAYLAGQGGSFTGVNAARSVEVPSRLIGDPQEEWGHVIRLDYPLGRDLYDRSTEHVTLWGWEGDR